MLFGEYIYFVCISKKMDLRRRLFFIYVVKRIMRQKYKNRKKRAFSLHIHNTRSYLQKKKVFASFIRSTLYGLDIRAPRSVWAYEREELWFNRMLNDNFESDGRTV